MLGFGLVAIGLLGVVLSELIKAAVALGRRGTRRREPAVQFTRNPDGSSGAEEDRRYGSRRPDQETRHAIEVTHMFLVDPFAAMPLRELLATHPPLADRIRRLDPQWDGKYPAVKPLEERPSRQWRSRARHLPGLPPVLGTAVPVQAAETMTAAPIELPRFTIRGAAGRGGARAVRRSAPWSTVCCCRRRRLLVLPRWIGSASGRRAWRFRRRGAGG